MKQAIFKIEVDGSDITKLIADRLETLVINDSTGLDSDTVTIVLDDRDQAIALPELNAEMQVWLGYEDAMAWAGLYIIDELATSDLAGTLSISGKASDSFSSLKVKRDQSYDNISFNDLLSEIAERNNYEPAIDEQLGSIVFEHVDHQGQSDLALLQELAKVHDAVVKPTGKRLVVLPHDQGRNTQGSDLPTIDLDAKQEGLFVDASLTSKSVYSGVKAHFKTPEMANKSSVLIGDRKLMDTLPNVYMTETEAKDAATARLARLKRQSGRITIQMQGNMDIAAERKINLVNHRHAGERIINKVTHTLRTGQVFTTRLEATPKTK